MSEALVLGVRDQFADVDKIAYEVLNAPSVPRRKFLG